MANASRRAAIGRAHGLSCAQNPGGQAPFLRRTSARLLRAGLLAGAGLLALAPVHADETITYTYDLKGRLHTVSRSGGPADGASATYTLDNAGNRSNVTTTAATPPSFAIGNASATEGSSLTFTVSRSGQSAGAYTMSYATRSGTATSGTDFNANQGTLTFASGQTSATIIISTIQDTLYEGNEYFYVDLSNASGGAAITTATGTGTIIDDDAAPPPCTGVSFTIASNGAVTEGQPSVFTVTKSGATSSSCSIDYATSGGTATSGADFTATTGTLIFASNQTSQTVSVTTNDDSIVESAESFTMSLSSPNNGGALGSPSSATATINDNDVAQTVFNITLSGGGYTNLRTAANNSGYSGAAGVTYNFNLPSNQTITGSSGGGAAIDTGSWPSPVTLTLTVNGTVSGGGGNGGNGGTWPSTGSAGGTGGDAIQCHAPIAITANGAVKAGGGGGGGGGSATFNAGQMGTGNTGGNGGGGGAPNGNGGSGGSSYLTSAGIAGSPGTTAGGGSPGNGSSNPTGGAGGNYGYAGSAGSPPVNSSTYMMGGAGGAAGYAVRTNGTGCTASGNITGTVG